MNLRAILSALLISATFVSATTALAQDKGSVNPKPLPPLANPNDPKLGAKELFGRKLLPAAMPTRVVGFYAKGCIAGAEGAADQWRELAGDAAVAQSLLGPSRPGGAGDAAGGQGAQGRRLAGNPGRRHVAAARRPDVDRPRQPSSRPRCRYLADADAEPAIVTRRARGNLRGHDGAPRPARHRSQGLDADPSRRDPRRGAGAERAAHLRQRRDQEGAVPRSQGRPQLALQGAADVRPRLSLPYPHQMPAGQRRMRGPDRSRPRARAAAPATSPTGSRIRSCTRSRRKCRRSRGRR